MRSQSSYSTQIHYIHLHAYTLGKAMNLYPPQLLVIYEDLFLKKNVILKKVLIHLQKKKKNIITYFGCK